MTTNKNQEEESRAFRQDLASAREGDRPALDRLLSHLDGCLPRLAREQLGQNLRTKINRSDIIQDAYLHILQGLPSFRGETIPAFITWARHILQNRLLQENRFHAAEKRKLPSTSRELQVLIQALQKTSKTPSSEVSRAEDLLIADHALSNLPPDYRQVILLSTVEGLSHREIAESMSRGEGAVRMLLVRARVALSLEIERLENASPRPPE